MSDKEPLKGGESAREIPRVDEGKKLGMCTKLSYAAPTVSTLPFIMMFGIYGNQYYESFGASLAIIALFTALTRSMDILSDPLMSYITDSASCGKQGRRRPFMFIGCWLYSGIIFLLLNPPYASETKLSLWYGVINTVFALIGTFTIIPYDALGPELSEDPDERTKVFFISNVFDGIGTLVALALPLCMTTVASGHANKWICVDNNARVDYCLQGKSCGGVLEEGDKGAYIFNQTLATMLGTLLNSNMSLPDSSKKCIDFARDYNITRVTPLGLATTMQQNTEFCHCMEGCNLACDVANKRTGFKYVGIIFAIWFTVTMINAVCVIRERPRRPQHTPPIVPSLRSTFNNAPFRVLMPAWVMDALAGTIGQTMCPIFIQAIVQPEYMTMQHHGYDCYKSDPTYDGGKWKGLAGQKTEKSFDWKCRSTNVMAACGAAAILTAILALPVWNCVVAKFRKVNAWLAWSIVSGVTNLAFFIVQPGMVFPLIAISALNGIPLGAKFLADAVLSDIIDYDEFLTGQRREATYFMFKSFLPKIVMIPASALPIAFLGLFGYRKPVGGLPSPQPTAVGWYVRGVLFTACIAALISYCIKRRYPVKEEDLPRISEGIECHKNDKVAPDPINNNIPYKPVFVPEGPEENLYFIVGHFDSKWLQVQFGLPDEQDPKIKADLDKGVTALKSATIRHLCLSIVVLILAMGAAGGTIPLIYNPNLQFIPTLCVVVAGFTLVCFCYFVLRRRAVNQLAGMVERKEVTPEMVERLVRHEEFVRYHTARYEDESGQEDNLPAEKSERNWLLACCARDDASKVKR